MKRSIFFLGTLVCLASCSKKQEFPEGLLLSGSCTVEIESKTDHADLHVDGILIGHDKASTGVPCGEKQILVTKPGYSPYYAFHTVKSGQPLKITVELERLRIPEDFGLSETLVAQIKQGQHVRNPVLGAPKEENTNPPAYLGDLKALQASVSGAAAGAAAGGAGVVEGNWDSVEDWR